jgi:hypothetical protein
MRALAGAPVLHGLLSPESVLLSRGAGAGRWDVCVMDFALSTLPGVAWSPAPTSLMSDPRAPEQLADLVTRDSMIGTGLPTLPDSAPATPAP